MHNLKSKEKLKSNLQLISNFISTFLVAVVAIIAILLVLVRILGLNVLSVESGSMSPLYPVNSLVIVKGVDASTIEVGDVVTYVLNSDGVLVTHRVVDIDNEKETFTTKGDANKSNDPAPVLWGNVVGKVIIGFPKLGTPFRVISAEENRTKVIVALVVIGAISVIWDLIDKSHRKKLNKESSKSSEDPEKKQSNDSANISQ
jgi:signal peptidase